MKKIFIILTAILLSTEIAFADFKEHYDAGQQYLTQYQYSSAITEFKRALRINYLDNSARIGLANAYLARATHYANNERNWENAANDFRSALFYLKYYPENQDVANSASAIATATSNLDKCLREQSYDYSTSSRFQKAQSLRSQGNFAAAGYEFAATITDINQRIKAFEQIGDIMMLLGNNKKSAFYYQKAVALAQNNAALRLKYARVLDKLGQDDLAVTEYNFALSKSEGDAEILYALERIYQKKLEISPNNAELLANLGAIYQKQKKYDDALKLYSKAEYINPTNVTTRLNIGTLYQEKADYGAAIEAYNTILTLYPDHLEANLYKAQSLAAIGQKVEALAAYKKVLDIDPTNVEAKELLFDTLKTTMTPKEMLEYISKDSTVDRHSINTMYDYAKELHKQKKYSDAITYYKEVLKYRPNDVEVYINTAIAYSAAEDYSSAAGILRQAQTKFPQNTQIAEAIKSINAQDASGKYSKASEFYSKSEYQKALDIYLTITPATSESLLASAACYQGLANPDKALEYYKKAFELNPTNADIPYYIGVIYTERENWTMAKINLQKALALNKSSEKAQDLLASVIEQNNIKLLEKAVEYFDKGVYPEALKIISQILTEDPKNSYAYYYRGMIYDAQKKPTLALEQYKKSLQNNPDLIIVNYLLALDYDDLGQYKNALSYYKTFVLKNEENDEYKTYAKSRIEALKSFE